MPRPAKNDPVPLERPKRRARTKEGRERQLISLAIDRAEQQIRDGTVSPGVLTHYLRLATAREQAEVERTRRQADVLRSKEEAYESMKRADERYDELLRVMRGYSGVASYEEYERD